MVASEKLGIRTSTAVGGVGGAGGIQMIDTSKPHSTLDEREYLERLFNDAACDRLARSNRDYQQSHAEYIIPLAKLLNITRTERDNLEEQLEASQRRVMQLELDVDRLARAYETGNA